jgi:hypothetical protein
VPNRKPVRRYCRLYIMEACILLITALERPQRFIHYLPVELRTQSEPLRQLNVMRATPIKVPCILLQLERTPLATPPHALTTLNRQHVNGHGQPMDPHLLYSHAFNLPCRPHSGATVQFFN